MKTMVSSVLRGPRGLWLSVVGCVVVTAGVAGGCARVVHGTGHAGEREIRPARPIPVADLLVEPARFPARYPAAVVDANDVDRVLREIDGVPVDSEVSPPTCAPLPLLAPQKAAVEGVDEERGARLIVTVARPIVSLRARVGQLADCGSFTTATTIEEASQVSEVTVDLPPPPPVDADDTYAVDQTVTSNSSAVPDTRTLTLVGLVGGVRVSASWQQRGSPAVTPDIEALDTLFADAVVKVRRLAPG